MKRLFRLSALACALAFGVGARAASPLPRPGDFVPSEYAPYDSAGSAEITGFAAAIPPHAYRQTIAGQAVYLSPVTSYSRRWWQAWLHADPGLGRADPRANAYVRSVRADSTGHFRFEHLPAGEYFLRSEILCEPYGLHGDRSVMAQVRFGSRVRVRAGERASVELDSLAAEDRLPTKLRSSDWSPNYPRKAGYH